MDLYLYEGVIKPEIIEPINNFRSLKYLVIRGIYFKSPFELKLNNLKKINIINCDYISFNNNTFLKVKNLVNLQNYFHVQKLKN